MPAVRKATETVALLVPVDDEAPAGDKAVLTDGPAPDRGYQEGD